MLVPFAKRIFRRWIGSAPAVDAQPAVEARWHRPDEFLLPGGLTLGEACRLALGREAKSVLPLGKRSNQCGSFRLDLGADHVKCYETVSPQRAQMVQRATQCLKAGGVNIPQVYATTGHLVFAEWIEGTPFRDDSSVEKWRSLAGYQSQIHQTPIDGSDGEEVQFTHLSWLMDRLLRFGRQYAPIVDLERVCERVRSLVPPCLSRRVIAPDFIGPNLVARGDRLYLIDNEFLGIGAGFEFDLLNTLRVEFRAEPQLAEEYLAAYERAGDCGSLRTHYAFWDIVFEVKVAGKRFAQADAAAGSEAFSNLQAKVDGYAIERLD